MKKGSILSLLIVFSVLISCGFRLIACADEAALPEEASVAVVEEAPVAVSPQQAADAASAQQAVDTAPALPVMEAAPAQTAMEAAPDQPVMEAAPAQSTTAPASNPAPEPVANSAPVQSATKPASNPVPEAAADTPTSNSEPEPAVTPAADSSSEPVSAPVADSSSDHTTESTAESAETPAASPVPESSMKSTVATNDSEQVLSKTTSSAESDENASATNETPVSEESALGNDVCKDTTSEQNDILSSEANGSTSQTNIQAAEAEESDASTGMHAAETEMRAAEYNGETYSITLRNRVYGNTDTIVPLGAIFQLSIQRSFLDSGLDLDWFKALFSVEGASYGSDDNSYFVSIPLNNNATCSLPGIPSIYPVSVDSINAEFEYNDESGAEQNFATSYIVGTKLETRTEQVLTKDMSSTGDVEYTFMRFPSQDGTKLFVINDNDIKVDDPLELKLTVNADEDASYIFEYLSDEYGRKGDTITLNSSNQYTISLKPGEYGYITPDFGAATANLSKINALGTPLDVNITTALSSVGEYYDSIHEMSFTGLTNISGSNPALFSLFRAEKPKTDLGTPKTDDGNPGTDPRSDPGNDPGNPDPGPTQGSDPGTPAPGNITENNTPVSTHTTSAPRKDKGSPDTDQTSADTAVSQKTPSVGTSSPQTEAVDTADRTPISMYVLLMLAALVVTAAAIMISAVRSRRQFRR